MGLAKHGAWIGILGLGVVGATPFYRATPSNQPIPSKDQDSPVVAIEASSQVAFPGVAVEATPPVDLVHWQLRPATPPQAIVSLPDWAKPVAPPALDTPPPALAPVATQFVRQPASGKSAAKISEPIFTKQVVREEEPLPPRLRQHRVVDGDSLRLLALRYYADEQRAEAIYAANRHIISHPDLLPVGKEILIPQP